MKSLETIARRLVWWRPPGETLSDKDQLLARAMAYGALSDLQALFELYGKQDFLVALQHAPPGLFEPRSWRYWHLVLDRPIPPLPVRTFENTR